MHCGASQPLGEMTECSGAPVTDRRGIGAGTAVLAVLMILPWLWPWTYGPSSVAAPLAFAWACFAAGCLAMALQRTPLDLQAAVPAAWLAAGIVSSVIALVQWSGSTPSASLISPARIGEAYGNLRQRNQFASLTSLALATLVFAPPGLLHRWRSYAPLVVPLAAANAACASRTGLLQWVLVAALAGAWPGDRRRRLVLCFAALAAYSVAAAALPPLLQAWRGVDVANAFARATADMGCSSRKVLWANVLHLIAQRPWAGWGIGELDYAHYATLYPGERFCEILDNAHNLPLHLAVELGVPAAVLIAGATAAAVWRARPWRETEPPRQLAWAAIAVIGAHSMLEYPLWYGPFQLALLLALLLLLGRSLPPWSRPAAAASGVAILVVLAAVWAEYDRVAQAYLQPALRRPSARLDPVSAAGVPVLFGAQLRFAELSVSRLDRASAARVHTLALEALHYSPEPMVIEKVVESALLLGRDDVAAWHAARYRVAFPERYRAWVAPPSNVHAPARAASGDALR